MHIIFSFEAHESEKIKIESSSGLSKDDVENLVREAEANEEEDRIKRDLIEARNKLDTEIYQVEKILTEHKEKVPEAARQYSEKAMVRDP